MTSADTVDDTKRPSRPRWAAIAVVLLFAASFGLAYLAHVADSGEGAAFRGAMSSIVVILALSLDYSVSGEIGRFWRTVVGVVLTISIVCLAMYGRFESNVASIEFGTFLSADLHPNTLGSDTSTLSTTGGTLQVYGRISAAIGDKVTVVKTRLSRAVDNDKDEACIQGVLGNGCYRILPPAEQQG